MRNGNYAFVCRLSELWAAHRITHDDLFAMLRSLVQNSWRSIFSLLSVFWHVCSVLPTSRKLQCFFNLSALNDHRDSSAILRSLSIDTEELKFFFLIFKFFQTSPKISPSKFNRQWTTLWANRLHGRFPRIPETSQVTIHNAQTQTHSREFVARVSEASRASIVLNVIDIPNNPRSKHFFIFVLREKKKQIVHERVALSVVDRYRSISRVYQPTGR